MKRTVVVLILLVIIVVSITGYISYDRANRDFSPWMSEADMVLYLKKLDTTKPGEPDFWKKGHWVTAVEGRWDHGVAEYRIRYADAPKDTEFVWFWFVDMDQDAFSKKIQDSSSKGFGLVFTNSYKLPDGTLRYQGVWHNPAK